MSGSYRRIILTAVGVAAALGVSVVSYDLYQASEQKHSDYQYQPASKPGFRISPVTKAPTQHYKPNCNNPNEREDADLCAQWAAVDQVSEANRMASLNLRMAIMSIVLTIIGTGFLVWTFWETRMTARRQLRAYVNMTGIDHSSVRVGTKIVVNATVENKGQTPAHDVLVHMNLGRRTLPIATNSFEYVDAQHEPSRTIMSAGQPTFVFMEFRPTTQDDFDQFNAGTVGFFAYGRIEYRDIFGERHETFFRQELESNGAWKICGEGNKGT